MWIVRASVALALLTVTGCGLPFAPVACTAEALPALRVTVLDSLTDAPLAPTRIVASAGAYADTARVPAATGDAATYGLAHELAGVYEVTVERAGYRTWRRDGIRVRADECHVRTVDVAARLQRVP